MRTIKVNKEKLLEKIQENKKNHIKKYKEALVAYKEEALKQLEILAERAKEGETDLDLDLTPPVNEADSYDKLLVQFEWEVEKLVELSQEEFNQYVHDETDFAITANFSNSFYSGK